MTLANIIISSLSLAVLIGFGLTAWNWSRRQPPPMPPLPEWPDDDEAGEKLATWKGEAQ